MYQMCGFLLERLRKTKKIEGKNEGKSQDRIPTFYYNVV